MVFEICRTSRMWSFDEKFPPCTNCKRHDYKGIVKSKIYDPETGKPLTQEREVSESCWVIEINSLEDLKTLQDEVKVELIVDFEPNTDHDTLPSIEIYDGWRE